MIRITEYLTTKVSKSKIKATDETIKKIVKEEMDKYGHDCNLNHIDVSEVTNMYTLFDCNSDYLGEYRDLNPDISEWNVSNVKDMMRMFTNCKNFNCNISNWDVHNVIDTYRMFSECESFNQDISMWDVSNVIDMRAMFRRCKKFNQKLSMWNVSKVRNMEYMFSGCENFNQDLSRWDVSNVEFKYDMFYDCPIEEKYKPHFKE